MPTPGVRVRVERFWRAVGRLRFFSQLSLEEFLSSEDRVDACERNLEVAIEALIDVGEFLVARVCCEVPKSYTDIFRILSRYGVLPPDVVGRCIELVKLRNILIHNYVYVSPTDIHGKLSSLCDILINVMGRFLEFMKCRGIDP